MQKVQNLVSLVIPLRDVLVIEKTSSETQSHDGEKSLLFTMKHKNSILFTKVNDRDFLAQKLSDLLWKVVGAPTPGRSLSL